MFGRRKASAVMEAELEKPFSRRLSPEERRVAAAESRLGRATAALREFDEKYTKNVNGTRMVALGSPPRHPLDVELQEAKLEFNRALSAWSRTKNNGGNNESSN
jgi:hypothetical protein